RGRRVVRGGRALDDRGGGGVGEGDVLVADLDLHDAEVTGARRGRVADGAPRGVDGLDDARGALRAGAGRVWERVGGLLGPDVTGVLVEVVGEVLRRARVVRAVHGRD